LAKRWTNLKSILIGKNKKKFHLALLNFENVVYNGILRCMFRLRYTVYIYIEMKKIRKTNIDRMKNIGKGIHMLSTDIGVDLGTASILVYIKGKGVVLKEPSVVAFDRDTNKIKAIGEEARLMLGRTPGNIVAVRPLRQGVISDYRVTEKMLKYFIQKAIGKRMLKKPRISVCVPSGVTEVEKKAVEDATLQAGAREVAIIEEPIAAAIGAGIDISRPCGNMIVDIGGGTTDIAVISLGGTVVSTSIKIAGDDFDEAIVRYMRKKHNLLIGERTAEDIKIKVGSAYPRTEIATMNVRGRNLVTGLPKTVEVTSEETQEALKEATSQIVEAVHSVLEKTPPELASDIADRGIVLTGGGSLLQGLEELIESKTGIHTMTAEDPMTAVAIGTGKFIEFLAGYRDDK
jgi:rod shape-determining protein MreB